MWLTCCSLKRITLFSQFIFLLPYNFFCVNYGKILTRGARHCSPPFVETPSDVIREVLGIALPHLLKTPSDVIREVLGIALPHSLKTPSDVIREVLGIALSHSLKTSSQMLQERCSALLSPICWKSHQMLQLNSHPLVLEGLSFVSLPGLPSNSSIFPLTCMGPLLRNSHNSALNFPNFAYLFQAVTGKSIQRARRANISLLLLGHLLYTSGSNTRCNSSAAM